MHILLQSIGLCESTVLLNYQQIFLFHNRDFSYHLYICWPGYEVLAKFLVTLTSWSHIRELGFILLQQCNNIEHYNQKFHYQTIILTSVMHKQIQMFEFSHPSFISLYNKYTVGAAVLNVHDVYIGAQVTPTLMSSYSTCACLISVLIHCQCNSTAQITCTLCHVLHST